MPIAPPNEDHNKSPSRRDRLVQRIFMRVYGGWRPRMETPPKGRCWASDGHRVWFIFTDGAPIPKEATAVKWWMPYPIPDPPPPTCAQSEEIRPTSE